MKRLIIVCEGPTEHEFCMSVLAPEFLKNEIFLDAPLIEKSNLQKEIGYHSFVKE